MICGRYFHGNLPKLLFNTLTGGLDMSVEWTSAYFQRLRFKKQLITPFINVTSFIILHSCSFIFNYRLGLHSYPELSHTVTCQEASEASNKKTGCLFYVLHFGTLVITCEFFWIISGQIPWIKAHFRSVFSSQKDTITMWI